MLLEQGDKQEIDFDMLNNSTNIREAKFLELQKEVELVNDQFKNALKQKHESMLHNETLLKNLHEAEVRLVLCVIIIICVIIGMIIFKFIFLEKE